MAWNFQLPTAEHYSLEDRVGLERLRNELRGAKEVAIDTETTGLNIWKDIPLFWSLAWDNRRILMPASTLEYFTDELQDPDKTWLLANAKFDKHMLANRGIHLRGTLYDTQVMHALLYEEESHRLKDMARSILGWKWSDFNTTFKIKRGESIGDSLLRCYETDPRVLIEYASNDAFGTLEIYRKLRDELKREATYSLFPELYRTMWDLFEQIEAPFTNTLWHCERNGIRIDQQYLSTRQSPVEAELASVEKEINQLAGRMLNPNSPKQIQEYFFKTLQGVKPVTWTKGGKTGIKTPSTDSEFLEHYRHELPMAALLLRHRELDKLLGTYILGLADACDPGSRIHPRFHQDTARTGRLSSSDPNCFHPETEVLTPTGWVQISRLQKGERVAQYDSHGHITFVVPTLYVEEEAETLVCLENQHISLRLTPDHRCLLRNRKTGELRVFSAEDYPEDWQQIHSGRYSGQPLLNRSESYLRLLVAAQADGYYNGFSWEFTFTKKRKAERLEELLQQLGAEFQKKQTGNRIRFYLKKEQVTVQRLCQDLIEHTPGKKLFHFPTLLHLPAWARDIFCSEVFFWDGCWTRKNHYSSDHRENAEVVQTLLTLHGKRAHLRAYRKKNGEMNWQVDVTHRDYSLTTNIQKTKVPYKGKVYCLSVPSSYLLVRDRDKISVTGQCQNIPNPDNDKFKIRGAFIPQQGCELIVGDYEALEMRLLAAASQEEEMLNIFRRGWDIHMGNASMMYGIPYDDIVKAKKTDKKVKEGELDASAMTDYMYLCLQRRGDAKVVGFGLNYGMKANKLSRNLGCSVEDAEKKIELYLATYPAVSKFYEEAINETRKTGYAFSIIGRRRYLPEIASGDDFSRWRAERQAVNHQIQGGAADVARLAMNNIFYSNFERRYGCRMLLQVHDELVFECPTETVVEAQAEIKEWMEHPFPKDLDVPLTTSIGRGPSWMNAK